MKLLNQRIALTLGILLSVLAGAGSILAQGGGRGGSGGGGLNTTTVSYAPTNYTVTPTGVGSSSGLTIGLFNTGSSPLTIGPLTVSGPQAGDYRLGGTCVNGAVIPRSSTCNLQVTFTPGATGSRNATINATFVNANPLNLLLFGQGVLAGPAIGFSFTGPFTFAPTAIGTALFGAETTITNIGSQSLSVSYSFIGANAGDFVQGGAGPHGNCSANIFLTPLGTCNLGITFVPTAVGTRTATLRIVTNDPAHPIVDILLSGEGTPAVPPPPPPPPPIVSFADVTDLWGLAGEPDWSLSINHHKATTDVLVAVWHTYDVDGRDMWLKLTDGHWVSSTTYTGNLHRSTGTPFSLPNDPSLFVDNVVGTATLTFADLSNGTLSYTVNGVTGSRSIARITY